MNCVLPDTNVLIEFFAGDTTFADKLRQADQIVVSPIVYAEFLAGLEKTRRGRTQRAMFEEFLRNPVVECVDLTRFASIYFAEIHRLLKEQGRPVPLNDIWIAASALEQGAEVLTFDTHFLHIPILQCDVRAYPPQKKRMTNLTMPLPIDPSLPSPEQSISRIAAECRRLGILFGTAESCTGGLIGALVTDIPGVSEVFAGSVVSYANDVKTRVLGVTVETLAQHGAVSAETARSMAEGACRCLGCGAAVSVTGIAGPGGGTPEKPVGTVYSAVCVAGRATVVRRFDWGADRSRADIRHTTACAALAFLADELMETQP